MKFTSDITHKYNNILINFFLLFKVELMINFLYFKIMFFFLIKITFMTDRDEFVGDSDNERTMANASELSSIVIFYEGLRKDCGEHRKTSSRLSFVAHHGAHS